MISKEKRYTMKKPGFIITETIFSIVLAASVAAVTVLAIDIKTDKFHIDKFNPFSQSDSASEQDDEEDSKVIAESVSEQSGEASKAEISNKENSKAEESVTEKSGVEGSDTEESASEESASEDEEGKIKILPEPENMSEQPKDLEDMLKVNGYTVEDSLYGTKLIVVDTVSENGDGAKASVYCYQKSETSGYWWNIVGEGKAICDEAFIGENGSNFDPDYNSKTTPGGVFLAGDGFYINEKPDTDYPMFQITEDTYWVTDPESKFYNQRVEGIEEKDWSSADHMITSEKSYKYGLVVNYNTSSPNSEKTSAIFMQCGIAPTEGSIAVTENVMKTILEWLDKDSRVIIFINV